MPPSLGEGANSAGVSARWTRSGSLTSLEFDGLSLLLHPASEVEDGLAQLVLRKRSPSGIQIVSLLGLSTPGSISEDSAGPIATGVWAGLSYAAGFRLAEGHAGWYWHVTVTNIGTEPAAVDVVHTHDVALAPRGSVRASEYYVSQYLDLTPVEVAGHGTALAVRQNMPGERQPWALVGCLGVATGWATDALQLVGGGGVRGGRSGGGDGRRPGGTPLPGLAADLPSTRLQHEHTLVALQSETVELAPGSTHRTGFYGLVVPDHPAASGPDDAVRPAVAYADPAAAGSSLTPLTGEMAGSVVPTLFSQAVDLGVRAPDDAELARLVGVPQAEWREVETAPDGATWSFFTPNGAHVVTAAKEREVLRPHGHLMRTGSHLVPDERAVTTTAWMAGWFASQVTQGHVSLGAALSLRRTYLNLLRASGLRVFVAPVAGSATGDDAWALLGMPSAWAVTPGSCRWWYALDDGLIEVVTTAPTDRHEVRVRVTVTGATAYRLLVAAQVALGGDDGALPHPPRREDRTDGATLRAPAGSDTDVRYPGGSVDLGWEAGSVARVAGDEPLFADGQGVGLPWVTLTTRPIRDWTLTLRPELVTDVPGPDVPNGDLRSGAWTGLSRRLVLEPPPGPAGDELGRIGEVLPWFVHDALLHYLSPRGLEQFTGGGWGTRDVSQGPVGLLLGLGAHAELRDVVLRLLAAQNARGDWPQSFDFLLRHKTFGQGDAHGDVVYWPLLALADYLAAGGDRGLLATLVPFTQDGGWTRPRSVLDHVERALDAIDAERVPGTDLPRYGHGDWNDSLQPADPDLAARLVSTWTVTLQAQALTTLADALTEVAPDDVDVRRVALRATGVAQRGTTSMRELLLHDGVLAGYGLVADDRSVEHLIHPADRRTGLHYSVLPMIHAISGDLLTRDEAAHHLEVIQKHLLGPDGARLFDRPARYQGGPMEIFQRAEASTFFGREIGIMYTHAHLRYAEALARFGDAPGLLAALALANPVGLTDRS
uniref:cellobiose phosphorylase n=1 Tax=Lapillicoccus sp. TaxID=1909287 RepID=UPI0025D5AD9E